jgi:hypothetical protein
MGQKEPEIDEGRKIFRIVSTGLGIVLMMLGIGSFINIYLVEYQGVGILWTAEKLTKVSEVLMFCGFLGFGYALQFKRLEKRYRIIIGFTLGAVSLLLMGWAFSWLFQ